MKKFLILFVLVFAFACAAFNYRWYNVRVDKLTTKELARIELKSPDIKQYRSLNGTDLYHLPTQQSPFCTLRCGDLKNAMQEMARLQSELESCRGN